MGSQASGRPGGNPDFGTKYRFPRPGEEAFDAHLQVRVTPSMKVKLDSLIDKNKFIRDALQKALDSLGEDKA